MELILKPQDHFCECYHIFNEFIFCSVWGRFCALVASAPELFWPITARPTTGDELSISSDHRLAGGADYLNFSAFH